ncbi:glycoside hydrolase family 5 protein [Belliella marina]|uniref:Glycoside hydrolase family 5 protein n=1 Tax=Belliella marina TaxID=1644146 RepID=A0ABW4VJN1_9BACT
MSKKNLYALCFLFFATFMTLPQSFAQNIPRGINLTGKERIWERQSFEAKEIIQDIQVLRDNGFGSIRLPIAFDQYLNKDKNFLRELKQVVQYTESNEIVLILAYFDHGLDNNNAQRQAKSITRNWRKVLKNIESDSKNLYIELVNEPNINPSVWEDIAPKIIKGVHKENRKIPIIVGGTNFNSLFELSRTKPFDFQNIIYTFHYYEPYIFTHQGTEWTGKQNATLGIPYPFQQNKMPNLSVKAKGTEGEINHRDYALTGNKTAVIDKISQISTWAKNNQVQLWCTEYGASHNAAKDSRIAYLRDVEEVLSTYKIPGFVWEWEGNFGIRELLNK